MSITTQPPSPAPLSRGSRPCRLWALLTLAALLLGLAAAPARAQPVERVYLPMLSQPAGPPATVRFGTGLIDGALSGAGTSFGPGLFTLYYEVTVADASGLPLRLQWSVAGQRRPELDRAGLVPPGGAPFTGGIALSTAAPLPPGAYELRVFVDGLSSGVGRAEIR